MSDAPSAPVPSPAGAAAAQAVAPLLARLEELSRARPDRVLRLRGRLAAAAAASPAAISDGEAFELLIFRGFSSSTTHPTAWDPDQPALPDDARIEAAELLQGPLNPDAAHVLAGPLPVAAFLDPQAWR